MPFTERTFREPHAFKRDPESGLSKVDLDESEVYVALGAIGRADVIYAQKANKYFRDVDCKKTYTVAEVQALGLPSTAEIETARKLLIRSEIDAGHIPDMLKIWGKTSPQTLQPPEEIAGRLVKSNPLEREINRLNRATLGK